MADHLDRAAGGQHFAAWRVATSVDGGNASMKAGLVAAWLLLVGVVLGQVYGHVYSWSIFRLLAVFRRYGL